MQEHTSAGKDETHGVDDEYVQAIFSGMREFTGSALFFRIFDETILLVQEASNYLEGLGRSESLAAGHDVAMLYSSESVRLSNMLMQISSWLLAHRAYHRGDSKEIKHLPLQQPAEQLNTDQMLRMPLRMLVISRKTAALYGRIAHLDAQIKKSRTRQAGDIKERIAAAKLSGEQILRVIKKEEPSQF